VASYEEAAVADGWAETPPSNASTNGIDDPDREAERAETVMKQSSAGAN
jgi:hypothetical protein